MKTTLCLLCTIGLVSAQPAAAQHQPRAGSRLAAHRVTPEESLSEPRGEPTGSPEELPAAITLEELEQIALGNNPTLAQASARVQAARGTWVQEGLYPNPQVGYQGTEIGNEGGVGLQGAFIRQEIVRGCKLELSQSAAAQQIREAEQNWAAQELRVRSDVRIGFYRALAAQQSLEVSAELSRISGDVVESAQRLFAAQEVARPDVLQAQVEQQRAEIALSNARHRLHGAMRELAALVGLPDLPQSTLAGDLQADLPELAWEETLNRLWAESPELRAAYARVDEAHWKLRRECAEPIPNIELMSGVQKDDATGDTVVNLEAAIEVPIFNKNQGAIRRAQGELGAAQVDVDRIRLDLWRRLAATFERYETAREQAERYRQGILPNAEDSLNLVRKGYESGEFNYLALLTAQRTFVEANLSYFEALQTLRESSVLIDGLMLDQSLSEMR